VVWTISPPWDGTHHVHTMYHGIPIPPIYPYGVYGDTIPIPMGIPMGWDGVVGPYTLYPSDDPYINNAPHIITRVRSRNHTRARVEPHSTGYRVLGMGSLWGTPYHGMEVVVRRGGTLYPSSALRRGVSPLQRSPSLPPWGMTIMGSLGVWSSAPTLLHMYVRITTTDIETLNIH